MNYIVEGPRFSTAPVCEPILRSLPDWFGIEEAIVQYVSTIDSLPTFLAWIDTQAAGFLSILPHNPYAAEVYVMGVRPEMHRQGIGKALMDAAQVWLREQTVEYLQVKTLSASHSDPNYARTRLFYAAEGFRPLEEFPLLWDEHNPCLLMVKRL